MKCAVILAAIGSLCVPDVARAAPKARNAVERLRALYERERAHLEEANAYSADLESIGYEGAPGSGYVVTVSAAAWRKSGCPVTPIAVANRSESVGAFHSGSDAAFTALAFAKDQDGKAVDCWTISSRSRRKGGEPIHRGQPFHEMGPPDPSAEAQARQLGSSAGAAQWFAEHKQVWSAAAQGAWRSLRHPPKTTNEVDAFLKRERGAVPGELWVDFFGTPVMLRPAGNALKLVSLGPDLVQDTGDEIELVILKPSDGE